MWHCAVWVCHAVCATARTPRRAPRVCLHSTQLGGAPAQPPYLSPYPSQRSEHAWRKSSPLYLPARNRPTSTGRELSALWGSRERGCLLTSYSRERLSRVFRSIAGREQAAVVPRIPARDIEGDHRSPRDAREYVPTEGDGLVVLDRDEVVGPQAKEVGGEGAAEEVSADGKEGNQTVWGRGGGGGIASVRRAGVR